MTSENFKECFPVRVVSSLGTNFDKNPIEGKDSVYSKTSHPCCEKEDVDVWLEVQVYREVFWMTKAQHYSP